MTIRCPFCRDNGARVDSEVLKSCRLIHSAVTCKNPDCIAYDPITYGYHPNMSPENHRLFKKLKQILINESDFPV